ncbi:hypothetical protein F4778DRAFT_186079 [Xylariomycetidae sp. FL2044]|nr:hypothetical protein F4778DRAFT_186079 [Xylariomycetidae sp. FL2044]
MSFKANLTNAFPPKARFTEKNVGDLTGRVYIVTGANTGVGKDLSRMLYSRNATVYMLARSSDKTNQAIADIKKLVPVSSGALKYLHLDLGDLASIKGTVERFLALESKLHVLWNNAGFMSSDNKLTTTPQGYEQHVGVNVLGGFLLTKLLTPILEETAKSAPANTVRVVWVSSTAGEIFAQKNVGATPAMMATEAMAKRSGNERYWYSKVGNLAHGLEYALRQQASGVISVSLNPGNLQSDLYRDQSFFMKLIFKLLLYPVVNGAYTELFAGLSPDITLSNTGCWVIPFGRLYPLKEDLNMATKTEAEGGTGGTRKFWEWSEEQVRPYL